MLLLDGCWTVVVLLLDVCCWVVVGNGLVMVVVWACMAGFGIGFYIQFQFQIQPILGKWYFSGF